ncbi:unnamed protein product, partial [Rotaria sp. Silwood2]
MKKQQQPLSKKTINKSTPISYSRSTLILNRLRAIPNGRNAIASSSYFTSLSQSALTATNSKNKQTVDVRKHGQSSENKENDDSTPPILH